MNNALSAREQQDAARGDPAGTDSVRLHHARTAGEPLKNANGSGIVYTATVKAVNELVSGFDARGWPSSRTTAGCVPPSLRSPS